VDIVPSFSPDVQTAKIDWRKFSVNESGDFKIEKIGQLACEFITLNIYGFAQKFNRAKPLKLNTESVED